MSVSRERERRAYQIISQAGEEGILQNDMWRRLGIRVQEASRFARRFEEKGVIKRQRELHEGRWTYRIVSTRKPITMNSILDCPCLACGEFERCSPRGQIRPSLCTRFTYWINPNKG